jgi:polyphenol oxidase
MQRRQAGELVYYTFESLDEQGVLHGIFTRLGGVSPAPWGPLNTAGTVGDSRENIVENRRRMFAALGRKVETIFDVWQVHSPDLVYSRQPRPLAQPHQKADGILSDNPEITLMMRFADCVPIFLYHPGTGMAALVHAGWKGTVLKIGAAAVREMCARTRSAPRDLLGAIGPSIGPDHYQVREDVLREVRASFGSQAEILIQLRDGKTFLNLWRANQLVLEGAGLCKIEISAICTACHTGEWFSHRAEEGRTGRFGAILVPGTAKYG